MSIIRKISSEVYIVTNEGVPGNQLLVEGGGATSGSNLQGSPINYGIYPFRNSTNDVLTNSKVKGVTYLAAPSVAALSHSDGGQAHSATGILPGLFTNIGIATSSASRQLVGHPIMIYQIPQIVRITYPASLDFKGQFMENYPLNRTSFRLIKGVQNEINFYVRDVDRKPISLGMSETLTISMIDPTTDSLLMSRVLSTIDASQGIYLLTILPNEMDTWPNLDVQWSITYTRADNTSVMLWTDQNYSPYSTATITKGAISGPSPTITVLWGDLTYNVGDGNYYSNSLPGSANYGFTGGLQSFFMSMTNFTGSIRIDASLVETPSPSDWFQVDTQAYTANTGTALFNETGNYLWMRVVIIPNIGTVDQIQYKR